jgi:hypothetical protein
MDEELKPDEAGITLTFKPRPLLLTILCLVSFVYFALLSLFFFTGLFNAGWITRVTNQYVTTENYSKTQVLLVFGSGFLLHALAFTGTLLIWKLHKAGYYFLGLSCLIIATYQLINPLTAITSTAIYIFLILIFGIFYNRLR